MESVLRGLVIYGFVLLVFRLAGKRTMAQVTPFDFILVLIISEATQNGMVGKDYSITNAFLLISTLVGVDIALSHLKQSSRKVAKVLDDTPTVIITHGRALRDRMDQLRVDETEVLSAARQTHGLERLDQVKYAVVEPSGEISIIPVERER
jgi:uncharacterized membrane protein YcaP (DUF421 family)